jgi:pimeloyl-ACP methyl ester carboxylesterase
MVMRNTIIVLLALVLLIAGCVQPSGGTPGTVVNVTQNGTGGTITPPTQPPTVNVTVNQTTTTNGTQTPAPKPPSQEVSYITADSWKISGTFYASKSAIPKTGIILLHQVSSDRSGFDSLVPVLHESIPDADILAIDLRGHGRSTNLGTYSKFISGDYRAMTNDVKGAIDYLKFFRHVSDNFYIVGASVGSSVAINYADSDSAIQKIVMLSPGMNYQGVDIKNALGKVRKEVYFVATNEDEQSATDAQAAYQLSNAYTKEVYIYKSIGAAHGTDMLASSATSKTEEPLATKIANWLK